MPEHKVQRNINTAPKQVRQEGGQYPASGIAADVRVSGQAAGVYKRTEHEKAGNGPLEVLVGDCQSKPFPRWRRVGFWRVQGGHKVAGNMDKENGENGDAPANVKLVQSLLAAIGHGVSFGRSERNSCP